MTIVMDHNTWGKGDFVPEGYAVKKILKETENSHISVVSLPDGGPAVLKVYDGRIDEELFKRLSQIKHPNLASLLSWSNVDGSYQILEAYVPGVSLEDMLAGGKRFSEHEIASIGKEICEALEMLHKNGIVYRDLKPSNIIMLENGNVKLVDFNVARLFAAGKQKDTTLLGTQGYAPPEQYGYQQTDIRADIYALGATLYELRTGHLPTEAFSYQGSLKPVIKKCLSFRPEDRYADAKSVKSALAGRKYRKLLPWLAFAICLVGVLAFWQMPQPVTLPQNPTSEEGSVGSPVQQGENEVSTGNDTVVVPTARTQPKAANMTLSYVVNQSEEDLAGRMYQNGEGTLTFSELPPMEDAYGVSDFWPDARFITYAVPESCVRFVVRNDGGQKLINPKVNLKFTDVFLIGEEYVAGRPLEFSGHIRGIGMYTDVTWRGDDVVAGDEESFTLDMNNDAILSDNASVKVIISADNYEGQIFTLPIKLH